MKLTYFTSQTMPKGSSKDVPPAISFGKGGLISLNKAAVLLLGLSLTDKISIAQDEEEPANWYIFKDAAHGFECRAKDFEKCGSLALNHSSLRNTFLDCFGLDTKSSYRFLLAGKPTTINKTIYYGILVNVGPVTEE